jgi:hypothetical protein
VSSSVNVHLSVKSAAPHDNIADNCGHRRCRHDHYRNKNPRRPTMSFELRVVNDLWELKFLDEPSYVHALKMAPESMEPELNAGVWLVVVFPVWSGPVRDSVRAAITFVKDHGGKFQLGVRPFDSHDEIYKWWPVTESPSAGKVLLAVKEEGPRRELHISTDPSSSPLWLVLRDGEVIHHGAGPRSKEQLSDLMQGVLSPV